MSWEDAKPEALKETPSEPVEKKEEPKVETQSTSEVEKPKEEEKVETKEPEKEETVPQSLVGRALKKQREKYKLKKEDLQARIEAVEAENKRLKEQVGDVEVPVDEEDVKIRQRVREEFLYREDLRGREVYGDEYEDALALLKAQNDPVLYNKIVSAASPSDTLMKEMRKIAEEKELEANPKSKKKLEAEIEEKVRKKLEAEFAEKLKARVNQSTDVQSLRAAGGDVRANPQRETWTTGSKPLPR